MKKSKAIAIFCLLFIILTIFATISSLNLNKYKKNENVVLAAVVQQSGGGGTAKYVISLENLSLLTDVSSCENSTRSLIKASSASGETKNVYACVYNNLSQNAITNCVAGYIPTAAQAVYGLNNNNSAFARFCQSENINSGNQTNNQNGTTETQNNSGTTGSTNATNNANNSTVQENSNTQAAGKDSGTTTLGDRPPRLEYDNLCASEGFRTASKIAGIIILVAKWLGPLILIILGMIDFGKAFLSGNDKSLSDATTTLIKRMIIAIIVPFIPGLLFYLVDFFVGDMKDENGESILNSEGEFQYCTDCLKDPLNNCPIELYDYNNQK